MQAIQVLVQIRLDTMNKCTCPIRQRTYVRYIIVTIYMHNYPVSLRTTNTSIFKKVPNSLAITVLLQISSQGEHSRWAGTHRFSQYYYINPR